MGCSHVGFECIWYVKINYRANCVIMKRQEVCEYVMIEKLVSNRGKRILDL